MLNEKHIKEVMRLADEIADYAWKQGLSDGAYSQADHDRKSCDASRAALEAYLRTIGTEPENTFPLNPNAASKWAHLQKHDGAEAIGVVFRTGSRSVGSLVDGRVVWADWLARPNGSKPESVNAELLEALKGMALSWGSGFSGGESPSLDRARAAIARAESAMPFWPNHPSAISDPLFHQARGIMGTENFGQEEALRLAILHVLNARAESAIESSPKPATFPAMKAAFRTTRVEAGEFIMAFKFRDIEDMDRADDEWRAAMAIETPAKVSPASTPPLPHHVFRELVNDLRDLAKRFHGHESLRDRISGRLAQDVPVVGPCQGHAAQLPDPLGLLSCTHPDCGRYEGPRSHECRAMADNACARPSICQGHAAQQDADALLARIARAIWGLRREEEDRCDMELEDMPHDHSVWKEAKAAIEAMKGGS